MTLSSDAQGVSPGVDALETMPRVMVKVGSPREPGRVDVGRRFDLAFSPSEERERVSGKLDDREVEALGRAEDLRVVRLVRVTPEPDIERASSHHNVVVGHGDAVGRDEETGAAAGRLVPTLFGRDECADGFNLDSCGLDIVECHCVGRRGWWCRGGGARGQRDEREREGAQRQGRSAGSPDG